MERSDVQRAVKASKAARLHGMSAAGWDGYGSRHGDKRSMEQESVVQSDVARWASMVGKYSHCGGVDGGRLPADEEVAAKGNVVVKCKHEGWWSVALPDERKVAEIEGAKADVTWEHGRLDA
jgi:hypothetical protein